MRASTNSSCTSLYNAQNSVGNCNTYNWLGTSTSKGIDPYWLINPYYRSTKYNYLTWGVTSSSGYGIKSEYNSHSREYYPVIYLKNDTTFTGSGTSTDPYKVNNSCNFALSSGVSNTRCTISVTNPTAYETDRTRATDCRRRRVQACSVLWRAPRPAVRG